MKPPFFDAIPIIETIESAGFEAYFVGGSVRDYLLERDITDIDIATSATPYEIKAIFPKTIDVGIQHGTVMVLHNGGNYEVTTFRSESEYGDFRRPNEVTFIRSLTEDLQRRDFTMNAIAMTKTGELIDPFSGKESISAKEIKTVGNAEERFREDGLRMMRALRFVSQLTFSIDSGTLHALKLHGELLKKISVERLAMEFEKLLLGQNHKSALTLLIDTELYTYLPGLRGRKKELTAFIETGLDNVFSLEEMWIMILYHFRLQPADVEAFLREWKQPINRIRRVKHGLEWLYYRLEQEWTKQDLYRAKKELIVSTERLYNKLKGKLVDTQRLSLEREWDCLPIKERRELAVTGQDLMKWFGLQGGPWIEEKLVEVENAVIRGKIDNRNGAIREWLLTCNRP